MVPIGLPAVPTNQAMALLEAAFESLPQGAVMFGRNGEILWSSSAFDQLLGCSTRVDPGSVVLLTDLLATAPALGSEGRRVLSQLVADAVGEAGRDAVTVLPSPRHMGPILSAEVWRLSTDAWMMLLSDSSGSLGAAPAQFDPLTNLPNRAMLLTRLTHDLERLGSTVHSVTVLLVDLDRFKAVNDTLGHPIGDALLRTVSERLLSAVRAEDLVARIGGDEFAIVQSNQADESAVTSVASRIIDLLKRPFLIKGHLINIGGSIGIASVPADATDLDSLMIRADLALYQAKANGRSGYCFFRLELQQRAQARRELEADLRKALMLRQFELFYQPQVDLSTGTLIGFEALLRWRHPKQGIINPAAFVPMLEELGLLQPVTDWILQAACLEAMHWPEQLTVGVNVAAPQFESDRLVPTVAAALMASGLPPRRLEIEVTETAILQPGGATEKSLLALRQMGVHIAMDDFGTGYSSLTQLRSFPFDRIKIDRSFVARAANNSHDAAIIRAIAALSTSLGMRTTAEGVETVEQLDRIRAEGVTHVQGFLLGHPVPSDQLNAVIAEFAQTSRFALTPPEGSLIPETAS